MPEEDYLTSMHLPKTSRFRSYEEFEQDIDIRASLKIDQILHRSKVLDADEQRALTRRRVSQHAAIPPRPREHRIRTSYETSSSFKGQYEVRSSTGTEQFELTCSKQTQPAMKTSASQRVLNDGLNSS